MDVYTENLERIKADIRDGKMIGGNIQNNEEITALHKEVLAYKSVQGDKPAPMFNAMVTATENKIDKLARRLNVSFIEATTTKNAMDGLAFLGEVQSKLSAPEFALFDMLQHYFEPEKVEYLMRKNNFNVYLTEANLNGYDDILKYREAKDLQEKAIEKLKFTDKELKNIEATKQAIKEVVREVLKELKANQ
jgi:hypothetical protein